MLLKTVSNSLSLSSLCYFIFFVTISVNCNPMETKRREQAKDLEIRIAPLEQILSEGNEEYDHSQSADIDFNVDEMNSSPDDVKTENSNRYKRSPSSPEKTNLTLAPSIPLDLQDIRQKLTELDSQMKGLPVLIGLLRKSDSSLCEELLHVDSMINFFKESSSCSTECWRRKQNYKNLKRQFGDWGKSFSLCGFSANETYGNQNYTALDFAAGFDDLKTAQILINNGADIHQEDSNGNSAIHFAAFFNSANVLKLLLVDGAITKTNQKGAQPLHFAARGDAMKTTKILVERGADVNARDSYNNTPLDYTKDIQVGEYLIDHGANPNAEGNEGNTRLHVAVSSENSIPFIKMLLRKGANVNVRNIRNETLLHIAALNFNGVPIMKLLLEKGANINARNGEGKTPLQSIINVSGFLDKEKIKLLIENGADVNVRNIRNETLLHIAALNIRAVPIINMLLEKGVDINARDEEGNTPLHLSTSSSVHYTTQFLIENGADVNVQRKDGKSPLHFAGIMADGWIPKDNPLNLLLNNKTNVNVQDNKGQSPLHVAVRENCLYCVKALVENGADTLLKNNEGQTAYQLLFNVGAKPKPQMIEFLKKYPH